MSKLGATKKPAVVRVTTEEKAMELHDFCDNSGWKVIIGIESDKPEDISDIQRLTGEKWRIQKQLLTRSKLAEMTRVPAIVGRSSRSAAAHRDPAYH